MFLTEIFTKSVFYIWSFPPRFPYWHKGVNLFKYIQPSFLKYSSSQINQIILREGVGGEYRNWFRVRFVK